MLMKFVMVCVFVPLAYIGAYVEMRAQHHIMHYVEAEHVSIDGYENWIAFASDVDKTTFAVFRPLMNVEQAYWRSREESERAGISVGLYLIR